MRKESREGRRKIANLRRRMKTEEEEEEEKSGDVEGRWNGGNGIVLRRKRW